ELTSSDEVPVATLVAGSAKAWVDIAVNGGVPSAADSFNVSSITDAGTGNYGAVWASAMLSDDYAVVGVSENNTSRSCSLSSKTMSGVNINIFNFSGTAQDDAADLIAFANV